MFTRNENGKLFFNKLEFECYILNIIENAKPKDITELEWMIKNMIMDIQLCAWDYTNENDEIEDEWEDVCEIF